MHQHTWTELPEGLRSAVESVTGPVLEAEAITTWHGSTPFVATLTTGTGKVFVKGAPTEDNEAAEQRRRETLVAPIVNRFAAPLIGHVEADGWTLLLFGFVKGGNADLSPGSVDLGYLAATLRDVQQVRPPHGLALPPLADQWTKHLTGDQRSLLTGNHLLHNDLVPSNVMVRQAGYTKQVVLVDWGRAVLGPAWAELAGLYMWLLFSGHTPEAARAWLNQFPAWRMASRAGIRAYVAGATAECADSPEHAKRWASLLGNRQTE
ncbi:phosphotransferase [Streptomyces sp. SID3343]|uniref:phosphotransferase family protein n=1 Tax=Streptomyces sp. SID3343 TaxID=2690260 RepID=UPI00136830D8|nr:phosphotransferase [Streptomyces sp. SID3343]MYW05770.1 phosphotransferase [Streptomyces sp. SID3343]